MPTFNWEINVVSLIALVGVAAGVAKFYFGAQNAQVNTQAKLKDLTDVFAKGMDKLDKNVEKMNEVVMAQALSNQRQDNFEESTRQEILRLRDDIKEMKHLKGFVTAPPL